MKNKLFSFAAPVLFLTIGFYFAYSLYAPSNNQKINQSEVLSEKVVITEAQTLTPSLTLTPTPVKKASVDVQKQSLNSCDDVIKKLGDQYRDVYIMDDILLSSNMECHYALQRSLGIAVNNGHIRDQRELLLQKLKHQQPVIIQQSPSSLHCTSNTIG